MAYSNKLQEQRKAKKLGLAGNKLNSANSFLNADLSNDTYFSNSYSLDFESAGSFTKTEPVLVSKNQTGGEVKSNGDLFFTYKSTRFQKEKEYFYSKYKFLHKLIGNFSFVSMATRFFSVKSNDFFKKFDQRKLRSNNGLPFVRLAFPKFVSNTSLIKAQTNQGELNLLPIVKSLKSKRDNNKSYLLWNNGFLNTGVKVVRQTFGSSSINQFSGFYIPYPNTVEIQQYNKFNVPLKIAAFGNDTKIDGGLLVVSTGDSNHQRICYVSPHSISTGFANTVESFKVTKQVATFNLKKSFEKDAVILSGAGLPNNLIGEYTEVPVLSKAGKKTFVSDNGTGNFQIAWSGRLTHPDISDSVSVAKGGWVINSGKTLNTGAKGNTPGEGFLTFVNNSAMYLSNTGLMYNEKYPVSGVSWTDLSTNSSAGSFSIQYKNKDEESVQKKPLFNYVNTDGQFKVKSFFLDSATTNSGLLPNGINLEAVYTTGIDFSGTELKYTLGSQNHLMQTTPLSDTAFHHFYNKLYSTNSSKSINRGTWDGIIPPGVSFSVEFISTKLDSQVGLNKDLYIVYSGYGSADQIDSKAQRYINTTFASKNLKKVKYEEFNRSLSYTSHTIYETEGSNEIRAKKAASKKIQGYIFRLMKRYIPEAIYENNKFRKFKKFIEQRRINISNGNVGNQLPKIVLQQTSLNN
jgi:hypothetical protein